MLSELQIRAFQVWKALSIELAPYTVIYGPSGYGKSAIIRALLSVHSPMQGTSDITHGQTLSRISLTVDGQTIHRVKSASLNRYEIDGDSNLLFDKTGKSAPDEVLSLMNLPVLTIEGETTNLFISSQFDLPCMVFDTPPTAARTMMAVTGIGKLTKAQKRLESDRRKNSGRLTLVQERINKIRDDSTIRLKVQAISIWDNMQEDIERYKQVSDRLEMLLHIKRQPPSMVEITKPDTSELDSVISRLHHLRSIKSLPPRPTISELHADDLSSVSSRLSRLVELKKEMNLSKSRSELATTQIGSLEARIHEVSGGVCPICGAPLG